MIALIKKQRGPGLEYTETDKPGIGPDEVLIKIKASSICGTDLHIYKWDEWANKRVRQVPLIQGHELCGDIVELGKNVTQLSIGDFVSAESHIVNYDGEFFKKGLGHVAPETKIIGVDTNGSYAEYIALPWQNARKNPKDMPIKIAVLKENFGNAVAAACAVSLKGKTVLITGCGPVGLMTILIAKQQGAKMVITSDISEYRNEFAKKLGSDLVINPQKENLVDAVKQKTEGSGVEVLLEMSGSKSAFLDGLSSLQAGGHAIAFGVFSAPFEFDISTHIIFKGITVHGVVGRKLWETWEIVDDLLNNQKVDLSQIVTHTYPIQDYKKAFETMESGKSGKVMMTF